MQYTGQSSSPALVPLDAPDDDAARGQFRHRQEAAAAKRGDLRGQRPRQVLASLVPIHRGGLLLPRHFAILVLLFLSALANIIQGMSN